MNQPSYFALNAMNTLSINLPKTTAKADKLAAPFAALYSQRSKVRLWAFSAAVRLSDQDKPIALKLLVELAIVIRILTLLAQNARCVTGKRIVAHRTLRPVALAAARRVKSAGSSSGITVRRAGAAAQRKLPGMAEKSWKSGARSPRLTKTLHELLRRAAVLRRAQGTSAMGFSL